MRELARTFEDLLVWQKAHLFVLVLYRLLRQQHQPSPLFRFYTCKLDTSSKVLFPSLYGAYHHNVIIVHGF